MKQPVLHLVRQKKQNKGIKLKGHKAAKASVDTADEAASVASSAAKTKPKGIKLKGHKAAKPSVDTADEAASVASSAPKQNQRELS